MRQERIAGSCNLHPESPDGAAPPGSLTGPLARVRVFRRFATPLYQRFRRILQRYKTIKPCNGGHHYD